MEGIVKLEKLTYSVGEAAAVLGVSKAKMYEVIKSEGFPVIMLGGRRLVSVKGLERWVEKMADCGGVLCDG